MFKHLSNLELSIEIILYFLQWYDTLELSVASTVAAAPLSGVEVGWAVGVEVGWAVEVEVV